MESEVSMAFVLTGEGLDPDEITRVLGITPSKIWRAGEFVRKPAAITYKHNGWRLQSDLPATADLQEHSARLLQQMEPQWDVFKELTNGYDTEFACVIYSYGGDRPPIHIDGSTLARFAELHADLDIDLYILPERRDP